MPYVLDFTSRDFVGQKFNHSRDSLESEKDGICFERVIHPRDEIGLAALLHRCRDGPPVLVMDSPRELRQLRAKARCCVDGQPIA